MPRKLPPILPKERPRPCTEFQKQIMEYADEVVEEWRLEEDLEQKLTGRLRREGMSYVYDRTDRVKIMADYAIQPCGPEELEILLGIRAYYRCSDEDQFGRRTRRRMEVPLHAVSRCQWMIDLDDSFEDAVVTEAMRCVQELEGMAETLGDSLPIQEILLLTQQEIDARQRFCMDSSFRQDLLRHIRDWSGQERLFSYEVFPALRNLGKKREELRVFDSGFELVIRDEEKEYVRFTARPWSEEEEFWEDDEDDSEEDEEDNEEEDEEDGGEGNDWPFWYRHLDLESVWDLQAALEFFSQEYGQMPWPGPFPKPQVSVFLDAQQKLRSLHLHGAELLLTKQLWGKVQVERCYLAFQAAMLEEIRLADEACRSLCAIRPLNPGELELCQAALRRGNGKKEKSDLRPEAVRAYTDRLCEENRGGGRPLLCRKGKKLRGDLLKPFRTLPADIPLRGYTLEEFSDLKPKAQRVWLPDLVQRYASPDELWRLLEEMEKGWSRKELRDFAGSEAGRDFFGRFSGPESEYVQHLLEESGSDDLEEL